jgi:hypothetical protein
MDFGLILKLAGLGNPQKRIAVCLSVALIFSYGLAMAVMLWIFSRTHQSFGFVLPLFSSP